MQINKKSRRATATTEKPRSKGTEKAIRADAKKPARATESKEARRLDVIERKLKDELEGTGAQARVREIVGRLLGDEKSPGVEALIGRLQAAARSDTASPYGT